MGSSMLPLTLLRNAEVYAPEPLGCRDVLIGGASILALAPEIEPPSESICEVLDLDGMRLLPGFVDSHVHLTGGGGESGPASRVPRVSFTDLSLAGVTTAVGVLGTDGTTRTVRELVATALALRDEGLSAYAWTGSYEVPPITLTGSVRGDITFVDPVIGVGEVAISDHRSSQPTFDEIVRLAADCHVAGMMSSKAGVLHLHLGDGPRGLSLVRRALEETELPPSTFFPTHVNRKHRLFHEALEIAARGVPVDVTAFPVEEGEDALAAEDAIAAYLASGAPKGRLTCSSDGGGCLPTFDATERLVTMDVGRSSALGETLRRLLGRGFGLADVLPVFTSNVADVLRLPKKGRITAGSDADLVTLDGEGRLRDVMARGRFVVRAGAPCVWGTFERPSPRAANP
jgi:beta-aspartyl-dipeptidase (metallo-type)